MAYSRNRSRRLSRIYPAAIEALEERQLMALTIDVSLSGGGKSIAVTSVGQVLNLDVSAIITSTNPDTSQYGLISASGAFITANVGLGAVKGNLAPASIVSPFNAAGSRRGTAQDLNGDGNLDVGGTNPAQDSTGWFSVRTGSENFDGTVSGNSKTFLIATITYTVTSLNFGGEADLNFVPRSDTAGSIAGVWTEHGAGAGSNPETGTYQAGTPIKITAPSAVPPGPAAVDDSGNGLDGTPTTIHVLANDFDINGTIIPSTVAIVQPPNHGGLAVVDPATGDVAYTGPSGFHGTETFTYTVSDNHGVTSAPATVTLNDKLNLPAPTAVNDAATALLNTAVIVPVLSNDIAPAPAQFLPASVAPTQPSHGAVVANADGTITYTPNTGYIGDDSFTYTATDDNGDVSNTATVNLHVGVEISSVIKGANRTANFTDADGTLVTIGTTKATADLFFSGSGAAASVGGKITLTGVTALSSIAVSSSGPTSTLTLRGAGGDGVTSVPSITDAGALGKIIAPVAVIGGGNLGGLAMLQAAQITNAALTIGGASSPALIIKTGNIVGSTIAAASSALTLTAGTIDTSTVTAANIKSMKVVGDLTSDSFSSTTAAAGVQKWIVTGLINLSALSTSAAATSLSAGSFTNSQFTGAGVASLFHTTGLVAGSSVAFTGGGVNRVGVGSVQGSTMSFGGRLSSFTAASVINSSIGSVGATAIVIKADVTSSQLVVNLPATPGLALGRLSVGGVIDSGTILVGGDVGAISAGQLIDGSVINVGTASEVKLDSVNTANIGTATLRSLRLTSKAASAFSASDVVAHTITSASVGNVNTTNGQVTGLAASSYKSVVGVFGNASVHLGTKQLTDANTAAAFVQSKGGTFGDFQIAFV